MKIHAVALMFPPMSPDEFAGLKADIKTNGLQEAIWTWKGEVIDGRNRLKACEELGIKPETREWDGIGSLVAFVVSRNLHRRSLTSSQRAALGAEIEPMLEKEAKERQRAAGGDAATKAIKIASEVKPKPEAAQPTKSSSRVPPKVEEAAPKRLDGEATAQAAKITGTSRSYVADAKSVMKKAPDLFDKVKTGEITLPQAKQEVKRQEKREEMKEKEKVAVVAAAASDAPLPWEIITGDVCNTLRTLPVTPRLIFADPPYNVGIDYGQGEQADMLPAAAFVSWLEQWIKLCREKIAADGSFWLLISDEFAAEACIIAKRYFTLRNWIIWYETFGVNCSGKFNRTKRHLFYCVVDQKRFVFNADAVTRQSARQVLYNDARAMPGGKLWDDLWAISRLTGTATERIPDFPTQLPLDLLRPIVRCCSDPGDLVLDPFNGSGTTGEAALESNRRYFGIEKSATFADKARSRLRAVPLFKGE